MDVPRGTYALRYSCREGPSVSTYRTSIEVGSRSAKALCMHASALQDTVMIGHYGLTCNLNL